jgi:acetyl/propionyl-CoA carboxylase alpha subunit
MDIPIYYDPMISKLITHGKDREEARMRMIRAIEDYKIVGLHTTMEFAKFVMEHEAFISGDFDTHFVNKHFSPELLDKNSADQEEIAAMIAAHLLAKNKVGRANVGNSANNPISSKWKTNRV